MADIIERTGYTYSDYIALMQHYQADTPFLDWTEDALSALYFALEEYFDPKVLNLGKDATLYIFSPALYNYARYMMLEEGKDYDHKTKIESDIYANRALGIPNLSVSYNQEKYYMFLLGKDGQEDENSNPMAESSIENLRKYYLPLAVYTSRLNKRIQKQNGIFLAYNIFTPSKNVSGSYDYMSLENIQKKYLEMDDSASPFLYRINIEESGRKGIASWVKAFGMSKEKCYPELSSIGERVSRP